MAGPASNDDADVLRYRAFGLEIESALPLAELRPAERSLARAIDVRVRLQALPPVNPQFKGVGRHLSIGNDEVRLDLPGFARFLICGGRDIIVQPYPGAASADIRCYLLGSAFAILLHQRGRLPLHASAIVADGNAILFMGGSGAGKSTLAQHFQDRGHAMLSDDVCVVDADAPGAPGAWPGVNRMKLWRASLAFSGRSAAGLAAVHYADDKFHLPAAALCEYRRWPVARIYLLARGADAGVDVGITPLHGQAAVAALFSHTFRGVMTEHLRRSAGHFAQCIAIARTTSLFTVKRNWGLENLKAESDALEQHFRSAKR